MVDRDIALLLIGAGIALVSGIVAAVVQHFLSLRVDKIKRERDLQEQKVSERKQSLVQGTRLSQLEEDYWKVSTHLSVGVEKPIIASENSSEDMFVLDLDDVPDEPPLIKLGSQPIRSSVVDDTKKLEVASDQTQINSVPPKDDE